MSLKKLLIIFLIIIFILVYIFSYNQYKHNKRADVKIPILLYHNFVTTIPDSDPDNFNYINTPESFEENVKTLLGNGYTIISMKDLSNAYSGKTSLPGKPIIITFDDGYYSNYVYIYILS